MEVEGIGHTIGAEDGENGLAAAGTGVLDSAESFFFVTNTSYMSYNSIVYTLSSPPVSKLASSVMYALVGTAGSGMISKL